MKPKRSLEHYKEMVDRQRQNMPQSKFDLIDMSNRKPHIYPAARGYPHKQWMCKGLGDCACENSPSEAYFKWLYRVDPDGRKGVLKNENQ